MDETNLKEWLDVDVGDVIFFKDKASLAEDINGLGMTVMVIHTFKGEHINYLFFEFEERVDRLAVKYNPTLGIFELRHYYPIEWMGEGTRQDFLRNNLFFLFQDPESEVYIPKNLTWSDKFSLMCGGEENVEFNKVLGGELYGELSDTKEPDAYFCGIVEYKADKPVDDPLVLIMETGGEETEIGGWLSPFEGHIIHWQELEVLKKQ